MPRDDPQVIARAEIALHSEPFTRSNHPAYPYETMLADARRMDAYRRAIGEVVGSGQVVADLGTGTGVLAVLAARAGASRVYAVDRRPRALAIAERVVRANGVEGQVRLVEGDVREVTLPEPVDVIVNELIGDFGTDEDIADCVGRFAAAHLRPGGRVVPERLRTFLVAAEYRGEFRGVWAARHHGLDLRAANALPCQPEAVMYALRRRPRELAAPALLEDVHFGAHMPPRAVTLPFELEIERTGALQGFAGYFVATLADGIELSNYPCYASCHWKNWHWPITPPPRVRSEQRVRGILHAPGDQLAVAWRAEWTLM